MFLHNIMSTYFEFDNKYIHASLFVLFFIYTHTRYTRWLLMQFVSVYKLISNIAAVLVQFLVSHHGCAKAKNGEAERTCRNHRC